MQLDNTRIVIRERDFVDVLDMALHAVRAHAGALAIASLAGALPFALFNGWLLSHWPFEWATRHIPINYDVAAAENGPNWALYLFRMLGLMVIELPLAAAPATRYLGHALFFDRPRPRQIVGELLDSAGQLIWYQVLLRGLIVMPALLAAQDSAAAIFWVPFLALLWLFPYAGYPYLNELILLERNPWRAKPGRITTWRRGQALHGGSRGGLFGRWCISVLYGGLMIFGMALAIRYLRGVLTRQWGFDATMYTICVPAAAWAIASFFTVVRYLSYLDLRIRRDGWEVELKIRAEAARLTKQIS